MIEETPKPRAQRVVKKATKTAITKTPTLKKTATKSNVARAYNLVESMLDTLANEIAQPEPSSEWTKLFGSKDSAVINLQKLVQVIGVLSEQMEMIAPQKANVAVASTLSREEIEMLTDWLKASEFTED